MIAKWRIALPAWLLLPAVALAQAPPPALGEPETVISEATREKFDLTVHEFVKSLAAPSPFSGKVARWSAKSPLCPKTVGLEPSLDDFMTQRIKEVAKAAGAPLARRQQCDPNMMVVFTDYPQALLDDVREHVPRLLGYVTMAQREGAATVSHPIQAWYATYTEDAAGSGHIDNADGCCSQMTTLGVRTRDGLRSGMATVPVVVDTRKTAGIQPKAIADYVALLTLTQAKAFDGCQGLPSIANLMAQDCGATPDALTENDIAYLKALYRMDPDKVLSRQVFSIAQGIEDALGRH